MSAPSNRMAVSRAYPHHPNFHQRTWPRGFPQAITICINVDGDALEVAFKKVFLDAHHLANIELLILLLKDLVVPFVNVVVLDKLLLLQLARLIPV